MGESKKQEESKAKPSYWTPRRLARMAIFIALSAVGSLIKIPSPTGTVALDAAPGYFAVLGWGYAEGAIVVALGHLFTAATVGFPLSIPVHLIIAVGMMIWAAMFRFGTTKVHPMVGIILGVIGNGILAPAMLIPMFGIGFFYALLPSLVVASVVVLIIVMAAYQIVKRAGFV